MAFLDSGGVEGWGRDVLLGRMHLMSCVIEGVDGSDHWRVKYILSDPFHIFHTSA